MNWDEYFINIMETVASKSKDPRTKVGAVVVGPNNEIRSTGFNGFPIGVKDTIERYSNRELKYKYVSHADANCIYFAARNGVKLEGCRMYLPWYPCTDCTKAIIQSGIKEVVLDGKNWEEKTEHWKDWKESMDISVSMLAEANVNLRVYPRK